MNSRNGQESSNGDTTNKIHLLRQVNLFSEMDNSLLEEIAKKLKEVFYTKGEIVFRKGEKGDNLFMIIDGKVRVHDNTYTFSVFEAGKIFGEYAIIDSGKRSATVTVLKDAHFLTLNREDFNEIMRDHPTVMLGILRILTSQIKEKDILETRLALRNQEILEQKKEIEKQKKEIEVNNEKLQNLNYEKNQIISIVAHDLRNPLTSAQSVSNMLVEYTENLDGDQIQGLHLICRSLKRMDAMITRILDVNKLEKAAETLKKEVVNIKEVLLEVLHDFDDTANRKEIDIHFEGLTCYGYANSDMVKHIIENLLSNSLKFSYRKTAIYLKLSEQKECILIEIKDKGPGISEKDQRDLFKKFQTLSAKPTEGEPSTGLGLSIVKKYTNMLNGKVWCESELGKGATFYVALPKANPN